MNTYAYAGSNPIMYFDIFGLDYLHYDGKDVQWVKEKSTVRGPRKDKVTNHWPADSGTGAGLNNPDYQYKRNLGPTIPGDYYIDLSEGAKPDRSINYGDADGWGRAGWRLKEFPMTKIKRNLLSDRDGGFHLHEDQYNGNGRGTAGCIGVPGDNINEIENKLQEYSKDHNIIRVRVNYE